MTEEFFRFMMEHNPFYFRNAKENFCVFKDLSCAYEALLDRLFELAPRGYIDLVLFLTTYCHMDKTQAEDFLDNFYRSGALDKKTSMGYQGVLQVNWQEIDNYKSDFERIATGLHWLTESSFNQSMFNQGFNMFKLKMHMFK